MQNGRKEETVNNARMFFSNGASKELVIASIQLLTKEEIEKIYEEVQNEIDSRNRVYFFQSKIYRCI